MKTPSMQADAGAFAAIQRAAMHRVKRLHFVGVGGSGMSGIAQLTANLGFEVSGSDMSESATVAKLRDAGVNVVIGHDPVHIEGADVVVKSTAIGMENPEIEAAVAQRIPVIRRAEMLAELMRFRYGIAVAGTHGKTTTTSLVASLLAEGGLDPTFIIGGLLNSAGANAGLGDGPYLVAEADESDASFLHLQPMMAIVTNIDADHMETYGGDFAQLQATFDEFLQHLPFYGLAVMCADDPVAGGMAQSLARPVLTYGTVSTADVRATDIQQSGAVTRFKAHFPGGDVVEISLNMPGKHNVLNALAAMVIARELGVSLEAMVTALANFQGIGRRFEITDAVSLGDHEVTLVDDYGHHPRELSAVLAAARACWPERRLVVAFQPHRFSRTRDLFDEFCDALGEADLAVISEVFAAGEQRLPDADGAALCRGLRLRGQIDPVFVPEISDFPEALARITAADDVVMLLGAGSVGKLKPKILAGDVSAMEVTA